MRRRIHAIRAGLVRFAPLLRVGFEFPVPGHWRNRVVPATRRCGRRNAQGARWTRPRAACRHATACGAGGGGRGLHLDHPLLYQSAAQQGDAMRPDHQVPLRRPESFHNPLPTSGRSSRSPHAIMLQTRNCFAGVGACSGAGAEAGLVPTP
ncbi:hypothetical protein HMPREF0731_2155 [Pseudoroseomonas cervicalis ATCC 49957]|uniref:Uncharacterized protein n=1 Tax=Pseudoroseomonas cervicalis ATCC 49957 TaxID=525371 RepID=D5RM44_9PROT|nr:hypothetical protein HMPREF0731_2155 [Pseudoroseomonas cervicalis ATCC 49957]